MAKTTGSTFKDEETSTTTAKGDYKVLNLDIKLKGKLVNLGGVFVNDKSAKVLKQVFDLIEAGTLQPTDFNVSIRDIFNSKDIDQTDLTADDFA